MQAFLISSDFLAYCNKTELSIASVKKFEFGFKEKQR